MGESPTMAQLQNKQNRDQQYLAVRVGRGPQPLDVEDVYKPESSDYIEDICPYATFQLSKPTYSESSYSGNVYSGPYHSVRGSFVYHDVKPPPNDKFKLGRVSLFSLLSSSLLFLVFLFTRFICHLNRSLFGWLLGGLMRNFCCRIKSLNIRKLGEKEED